MADIYQWRRALHIPFIIFLQIIFILLFGIFVVYDPNAALGHSDDPPIYNLRNGKYFLNQKHSLDDEGHATAEPSEKNVSKKDDAAKQFEDSLIAAIEETNKPGDSKKTIHESVKSLQAAIVRLVSDTPNVEIETNQEHGVHQAASALISNVYPSFQDVHVMIFIGFGFLMTFLKKYGLSAVSLNMMIAVICLQWATLVIGFFHLHEVENQDGSFSYKIFLHLTDSMLFSDFAAATVLISFGVVLGKTTPLQLIILALIEIVLFVANEIIGRKYLRAADAGDTIFVHLFGAYFGLACSRVMYKNQYMHSAKQASARTSDMFSMIGTIFLWMFWPSFNSAAAADGEPRHRAILNTYFSLCACVLGAFAVSGMGNRHSKFVMEHIQNATLAGGVAIGACADLVIQPYGALIVGFIAGCISVYGYDKITPWLAEKMKIHDTCGVHNLHGMPAVMGALLSCILAALATKEEYGGANALKAVYPALFNETDPLTGALLIPAISPNHQAINQLIATIVTFVIAIVGGSMTGLLLHYVEKWQHLDDAYHKGMTILKLALSVGSLTAGAIEVGAVEMPVDCYFDDNIFFHVHEDNDAESTLEQNVIIKDKSGQERKYRRQSISTIDTSSLSSKPS